MIIKIPYPRNKEGKKAWNKRYGLNSYYAGKHWSERKKDADYWHQLTKVSAGAAKPISGSVELNFKFNDRLDLSNHGAIVKMIEDGLVRCGIIKDDSRKVVKKITYEWHDEDYIEVEIMQK